MVAIRPLEPRNYLDAIQMWVETWQDAMPQIDFEWRRQWLTTYLPELTSNGFMLLGAFDSAENIMGFVAINPKTHVLDQIAISVQSKGKGVALTLMQASKEQSPSLILLNVNVDNARAIRFYEKQGFRKTGITGLSQRSKLPFIEMKWQL